MRIAAVVVLVAVTCLYWLVTFVFVAFLCGVQADSSDCGDWIWAATAIEIAPLVVAARWLKIGVAGCLVACGWLVMELPDFAPYYAIPAAVYLLILLAADLTDRRSARIPPSPAT